MFQDFTAATAPEQGPPRLAALRAQMKKQNVAAFLVPRADAHQGEYVAPRDDRLAWLTGFTGSAGFSVVLETIASVFIDGRYRVQVKDQVAACYTPVPWPETQLGDWLKAHLETGTVAFDPWLHTVREIANLQTSLNGTKLHLSAYENLIDQVWQDQPAPPCVAARPQPLVFAGETHKAKRTRLGDDLRKAGQSAAVLTLPDSIAWLLNIRGGDIPRNPVAHGFAILHNNGTVDLFMEPAKLVDIVDHLGAGITLKKPVDFLPHLATLNGLVRIDPTSAPVAVAAALAVANVKVVHGDDPCSLPKARKNDAEISGMRAAHIRDAAAVCECLAWFNDNAMKDISEIDVVTQLERFRHDTNALLDISFDTISGSGPNGAIIHYRVTNGTNRQLRNGDLLVLDSGGQYQDGTTDITRTLPVGDVGLPEKEAFTRVLQGMVAISRLRWPNGLAGRDLEAIGRVPLWTAGHNFDHGLGHGVGAYLCVHEGPQRLSRLSEVPLEPGMILSNEPGYYRENAFGIRIENLVVVQNAPHIDGQDDRDMLVFETLTYVPIERRLILKDMLSIEERRWIDAYHSICRTKIGPGLSKTATKWLEYATAPL